MDPDPPAPDPVSVPASDPASDTEGRWYASGLRFDCTQCGRCCQSNGEYEHLYLTRADTLALAGELGLSEADFRREYTAQLEGWTTLVNPGQACRFLTEAGQCGVYEARPNQCRTWPFWKENLREAAWKGPVRAICPGLDQGQWHSADEVDGIAEQNERWYEED